MLANSPTYFPIPPVHFAVPNSVFMIPWKAVKLLNRIAKVQHHPTMAFT